MPRSDSALRARHAALRAAKVAATWKLIDGNNSPETIAILWSVFIHSGNDRVPAARAHEIITSHIKDIGADRNMGVSGQEFCADLLGKLILDRRIVDAEEFYELSAEGHAALLIAERIIAPTNVATESQMVATMKALNDLAIATDPDVTSRIASLEAEKAKIDEEIERLRTNPDTEPLQPERAREAVQELLAQFRQYSVDFARVRRHLADTVNSFRRQAIEHDGSRGIVIEQILAQIDRLDATEFGRSFKAFYEVLADLKRLTEVEASIDAILTREFSRALTAAERIELRDMIPSLRKRASEVHRVYDSLAVKLRSYIEENQHMEDRRLGKLLNDTVKQYSKVSGTLPGRTAVPFTLSLSSAKIDSPTQWRLAELDRTLPELLGDEDNDLIGNWEDLEYLAEDSDIDFVQLRRNITETVAAVAYPTIGNVIARHGIGDGVPDLIGMVIIGFHGVDGSDPAAQIVEGITEDVDWPGYGTVTIPQIIFFDRESQ